MCPYLVLCWDVLNYHLLLLPLNCSPVYSLFSQLNYKFLRIRDLDAPALGSLGAHVAHYMMHTRHLAVDPLDIQAADVVK